MAANPVANSLSRAELESRQLRALRRLLAEVASNSFYAPRLRAAGLAGGVSSLEEFRQRMPFTTKQELVEDQAANPPYGTNLTRPVEEYTRFCQTSGTSGEPLRWLDTPESWEWMVGNWVRVFEASGVGRGDRIFFAFSFGPFLGFWSAFDAGQKIGALCLPGGGMSSGGRLRAILDNRATVLCCTPTYALHLGETAAQSGIDLSQSAIEAIVVGGEPAAGIPSVRGRIESLWAGARLWDHHGMTEIGPVSYECSERRGVLHIIEEAFIAEVVDHETGLPLAPGEPGELALTNLGRSGSPLLRYRTGDLVRPSARPVCACGSAELALEGGIAGRCDDMVVVRGVNLYPTAVEAVVRQFDSVAEYRVNVLTDRALADVRVEIEPRPDTDGEQLCRDLECAFRSTFNLRVPVQVAPPGSLPRFELKAKRWLRQGDSLHG